jgi:hypothetical protein
MLLEKNENPKSSEVHYRYLHMMYRLFTAESVLKFNIFKISMLLSETRLQAYLLIGEEVYFPDTDSI